MRINSLDQNLLGKHLLNDVWFDPTNRTNLKIDANMIKKRPGTTEEIPEKKDHYTDVPPKFTEQQKKSFKDQACEVLDILDASGNGIYDEDRYPGMYKDKNKNKLPVSLEKIFNKQEVKTEKIEEDEVDFEKLFQ